MKITRKQLSGLIREMLIKEYGDAQAIIRRGRYPDTKPRNTKPRSLAAARQMYEAIVEILQKAPGISGAELVDSVNQIHRHLDSEAIYDFLDQLQEDGEVTFDVENDAWSLT